MEIKIFPVFVCALILLWTTQELYGYTAQYVHHGNRGSGRKKKNEILEKVSLQKYVLFFAWCCQFEV